MRRWVLTLMLCACGDVVKVPDAAVPDAYQHDAGPAACSSSEMSCNNTCADPMTSEQHCGSCNNPCSPVHACEAGNCVVATETCARIRQHIDPMAPDGVYTNFSTGKRFYCDMSTTPPTTYLEMIWAQYNVPPAGYTLIRAADLATPAVGRAFIELYNIQGGLLTPITFSVGNCCAGVTSGLRIQFGSNNVRPNAACGGPYSGLLLFNLNGGSGVSPPLPSNYFAANPPNEANVCSDGNNPGMFFKTVQ